MIAMLIGVISTLFIAQLYTMAENQRRTISHGDDALTNGAIALHTLETELKESGVGISALDLMGCNLTLRSGVILNGLAPVTINHAGIPAGDPNTDTLLFVKGNDFGAPEGDTIQGTPMGSQSYTVRTPSAFQIGDRVVATAKVRPSPCNVTLDTVTGVNIASDPNVNVSTGSAGVAGGKLYNLGQLPPPRIRVYAIRGGNLTVCDYLTENCGAANLTGNSAVWVPVANNIVGLRAQYGRDETSPGDRVADTFNQALLSGFSTQCVLARNLSVRLAAVARSTQYEKTVGSGASAVYVTPAAPTWEGSAANNPAGSAANPFDLTKNPDGSTNPDWRNFRYRVFQTIVPLRNVIWMEASGC